MQDSLRPADKREVLVCFEPALPLLFGRGDSTDGLLCWWWHSASLSAEW